MGRMSDLWKPGAASETQPPTLEVVPTPGSDDDWFANNDAIPFIEVGGGAEKNLRVVPPTLGETPTVNEPEPVIKFSTDPLPSGLFTIRFRPVIAGMLPGSGFGPELIAYHDAHHPISEQYRLLLGEFTLQLPGGPPRVLLFTGATAEAGTTTVVLNIALTLARMDSSRVMVVDANLARPASAAKLGLANAPGLGEVLTGRTPLPWAIQNTRLNTLRVLAAGRSSNGLMEAGLPPIIERLRNESDWVLIDAPSWNRPADAVPLADCCDAVYLVARQPDVDTAAGLELQQGLLESTGRLKGCILTQQ